MAPNSEEDGSRLSTVQDAGWSLEEANKEQLRPPVYNPEDYAAALRKWGRRGTGGAASAMPGVAALAADGGSPRDHHRRHGHGHGHGHGHAASQHQQPPQQQPEMSLRQFSSASELLAKLRADLRLAYPSFVQEFIGDPLDGVTLLLELLRAVQQPAPGQGGGAGAGAGGGGGGAGGGRRALLDELACLQCLHACLRLPDAARRLARSPAGLYTLAVCVMSNATKSRVIALQLLTRACEPPGCGHAAVSEALSTLRLRLAEPVRFRLLAGMLGSAGGCPDLPAAGLRFLNTLLETAPGEQARLYLLAELRQAGFQPHALAQVLPAGSAAAQQLQAELSRWQRNQVDVAQLRARAAAAEAESRALREQVAILEQRVQILQEEKGVLVSLERCLKDRCSELEATVKRQQQQQHQQQRQQQKQTDAGGGGSTPAEDEGISSSDQEHSLEEREPMVYELFHVHNDTILMQETSVDDGPEPGEAEGCVVGGGAGGGGVVGGGAAADEDEETTIDEVIEELRNIINDAETEAYAAEAAAVAKAGKRKEEPLVIAEERPPAVGFTVRIQALEREAEIVPARLLPQPPRRARSLVQLAPRAHAHYVSSSAAKSASFFFDDEDDDEESPVHSSEEEDSDSLLSSAARDHCGTKKWTVREAKSTAALRLKLAGAPAGERGGGRPVRRSESFHQVLAGDPERRQRLQGRCGSFDGLFCVTDSPRSRPRSPPSTAVVPTLARNRHHSKSLDCIDEGLHALVDVVVASTAATAATSVSVSAAAAAAQDRRSSGRGSTTDEWSLEWDKNYLAAAGRYPPDGASKPPVYLPAATRKNSFDAPFLVRGGHGNAGLYSGRQALSREAIAKHSARARSASSAGATPGRKVSVSVKVTDLPSGLY
ncbi:uncharacterized protein LOC126235003 [Schistocerca nitens]|uniref:uncharacterized protein LOC126235003 n=1 Tax=Schistocerca nitens TaxID=7011 RepID=UPI0021185079|nr:uncharacterized protein LOC126235003 [Schistocerca nitens]